jgi:two-component system sensor histidine kinase RegB
MSVDWDDGEVRIAIRDFGPGIDPALAENIGKPVIRTGRAGLGIGLMLSQAAVERCGGSIELSNHADGGALAVMHLPRQASTVEERTP